MMTGLIGIFLFLVIFICYLYCNQSPQLWIVRSETPGPTILVVAGTHGNEPAGAVAADQFFHYIQDRDLLKRGTLIVIPDANKWGLKVNLRYLPAELLSMSLLGKSDLNRSYAHAGEEAKTTIAEEIQDLALQADWVIDLHEGYDFHQLNPNSMGSGIYPGQTELSKEIIPALLQAVNQIISNPQYQFISKDWPDQNGTLRMFCDQHQINYTLVETSGQQDIQPLAIRSEQHFAILHELLSQFQML